MKPAAAPPPPESAPVIAAKPTIDQAPDLETDPLSLYNQHPVIADFDSVPANWQPTVKRYFKQLDKVTAEKATVSPPATTTPAR